MMTNPTGRLTQGQFSFLPDLTDAEITLQIDYAWPRAMPGASSTPTTAPAQHLLGDVRHADVRPEGRGGVMLELQHCRKTFPNHYIRLMAFDSTRGVESIAMSFIVNRPANEPGFGLVRQEGAGRSIRYTVHSYATDKPESQRY